MISPQPILLEIARGEVNLLSSPQAGRTRDELDVWLYAQRLSSHPTPQQGTKPLHHHHPKTYLYVKK